MRRIRFLVILMFLFTLSSCTKPIDDTGSSEKEKPKDLPKKGQPAPVNSDTGKIEDTKELIDEAKKLEKN